MNPAAFSYHRAGSVQDAIALLHQHESDGAKLLAGGHSLLPVMKLRLAEPAHLIDIGDIGDLRGVRLDGETIVIGAMTTHRAIERDQTLLSRSPLLVEMAKVVGDRQVRARGTIGGTLAHADPAADYPAGMLALDAEIVAVGPNGERTIPASDFFAGFLTTALAPEEVLTEVRLPAMPERTGHNYQKLANQASGYAVVGVAAVVTLGADGTCETARIGITGAGDHATRASAVEAALRGSKLDGDSVGAAAKKAADGIDLLDDIHASSDYRQRVVQGLTRRAILQAAERVAGG
jgi:carbon-monoxide dehydrogenase medium subunit